MILAFFIINLALVFSGLCYKNRHNLLYNKFKGSFWKNLRGIEQKIWYASEAYQRKKLDIKTISDAAFEKLRTKKRD